MNLMSIRLLMTGLLCISFFLCMGNLIYGQSNSINWVRWSDVPALMKKDKKKIVVDIYTDWCGWCKRMDASTLQDPKVIKAINKNFYAVKFNAEQKEDINFKSKVYQFVPQGNRGYHSLAAEITQGRLSYPTFVFLDEELNTIQPIPGYQDATIFEMISIYFGDNHYKTVPFKTFQESYK